MSEEELIKTLRVFEKNRVDQLEEPARNLFYAIMKIASERDRLNNIINELEKWLGSKTPYFRENDYDIGQWNGYVDCKNKLQELKGEDK